VTYDDVIKPKEGDMPASVRQLSYIDSLLEQKEMTEAQREYLLANANEHPSLVIDTLKDFPYKRVAVRAIEPGIYYVNGEIYKVQISQTSGRAYAKKLDPEDGWVYDPSYIKAIPEGAQPPTFEEMFQFGRMFGICGNCGKTLSDPDSVYAKIGPVCAKRLYGLTPKQLRSEAARMYDRYPVREDNQEDAGIWRRNADGVLVNMMHP
jgi:hypothetical protein